MVVKEVLVGGGELVKEMFVVVGVMGEEEVEVRWCVGVGGDGGGGVGGEVVVVAEEVEMRW